MRGATIINAKKYLGQYQHIGLMIESLLKEKQRLNKVMDDEAISEQNRVSISELQEVIDQDIENMKQTRLEIQEIIQGVSNVKHRLLLHKRYLMNEKWDDMAYSLGYSVRTLHNLHNRAIEAIQERLRGGAE